MYVTDAPRELVNKLKICTLHFSEDMICTYSQRRVLKDSAIPVLYLPNDNEEPRDPVINENIIETNVVDNNVPQNEVLNNLDIDNIVPCLYANNNNRNVDNSNTNINIQNSVNINSANSNLLSDFQCAVGSSSKISTQSSHNFKKTIKNLKTLLRKKKKYIRSQSRKIKELHQGNMWDDLTTHMTESQRIFFEVIRHNLKSKPEV